MALGNFAQLAQAYHRGRRDFDDNVFDFLAQQVDGLEGKKILDVGCGTGIATRQLAQLGAEVIGSDISKEMVAKAQLNGDNIKYVVAPTHTLPFENDSFDLITAFSAFHWFADPDSVNEIKRVLKSGGVFAAINKNDVAGIRKDINRVFAKYKDTVNPKQDYNPEKVFKDSGFVKITTHTITGTEIFTSEEAFIYLQSIAALWNSVPEDEKDEMLDKVKNFCDNAEKQEGMLKRDLETVVVVGFKT